MVAACGLATDGNGREMAVESTGDREAASIMDRERGATS